MNTFEKLLELPKDQKEKLGVLYTPAEIAQQPRMWRKAVDVLRKQRQEISEFLALCGLTGEKDAHLILTGAGTSGYIGDSVQCALRKSLQRQVNSIHTTDLVTHASSAVIPGRSTVVINFARSGNSPESEAAYKLVKKCSPGIKQIAITCDPEGTLGRLARQDPDALCIILPEETLDQSLAMTSSFSTMALTALGLAYLDNLDELEEIANKLASAGELIVKKYGDLLHDFATLPFTRACYLGSGTLHGTMQECQLKMLEMTEGQVACKFDTYLGFRHGPQVFANADCVIIAALAANPKVRQYEIDLLKEIQQKEQGMAVLIICDRADEELSKLGSHIIELFSQGDPVNDEFRIMTDVMVGQIIASFASLDRNRKPDNPSESGTITRVVQGVVIYPE